jgi:hypothetical protein
MLRMGGALDAAGDKANLSTGEAIFSLYGQNGSVGSVYTFLKPKPIPGIEAGAALRLSNFSIGATWMRSTAVFTDSVTATIPSPQIGGAARVVRGETVGLGRSQDAIHLECAVTLGHDKWVASVFAGPSLIKANQTLVTGISVQEQSGGGAIIAGFRSQEMKTPRAVGFNLGFEASRFFTDHFGIGADVRYSRASVKVQLGSGESKLVLGGYHVGYGLRFRF